MSDRQDKRALEVLRQMKPGQLAQVAVALCAASEPACSTCGHTAESLRAAMGPVYTDDPECNEWQCSDEWCYGIGKEPSSD
jgi:hypothetical protein